MKKSTRVIVAILMLCGNLTAAWACNLPLDPKVFILPDCDWEKSSYGPGIYGGGEGPHIAVVINENSAVTFKTYLDMTGRVEKVLTDKTVTIAGQEYDLITLTNMKKIAELKLKFSEMLEEQPCCSPTDPNAISLGGTIKNMTIRASGGGGHFGGDFSGATGLTDLKPCLPNPDNPKFTEEDGTRRYRVTSGEYEKTGKFYFKIITSRFEIDKSNIEGEVLIDAGEAGETTHVFNVPTTGKESALDKGFYYAGVGKVDMTLAFEGIKWKWEEVVEEKNASGTWDQVGTDDGEYDLEGEIVRTSEGSGTSGGHPGYFYVKTRDVSSPVYCRMTGPLKGPSGTTGDLLPGPFDVTFEMVDNNFNPTETTINVDLFHTLAVTDYKDGNYPKTGNPGMDSLKFSEYKDNIIWKKISSTAQLQGAIAYPPNLAPSALSYMDVAGIGKVVSGPLTHSISTWKASFTCPDKMGYHFSTESTGDNSDKKSADAKLLEWKDGILKYFIIPQGDGSGNSGFSYTGPVVDSVEPEDKFSTVANKYETLIGLFPDVTKGTPAENYETVMVGPDDKTKIIGNLGYWDVADNDPPNVFLAIQDTKTGRVNIYGDNTRTMDAGLTPYTNHSETKNNNHIRTDSTPTFEFLGGDSDGQAGYDGFQHDYGQPYNYHNNETDQIGFWCDEDSKLVFSTWGYDNINTFNSSHGLSEGSTDGNGEPCWWGKSVGFANFTIHDAPGNVNGKWFPEYIFRYPNRPKSLNSGDCSIEVACTDPGGRKRTVKVNVYVIWNKKEIRGLEERKYRSE